MKVRTSVLLSIVLFPSIAWGAEREFVLPLPQFTTANNPKTLRELATLAWFKNCAATKNSAEPKAFMEHNARKLQTFIKKESLAFAKENKPVFEIAFSNKIDELYQKEIQNQKNQKITEQKRKAAEELVKKNYAQGPSVNPTNPKKRKLHFGNEE